MKKDLGESIWNTFAARGTKNTLIRDTIVVDMNLVVVSIQFLVTCFFFFLEALFHFNIGKSNGDVSLHNIVLPDKHESFLLCVSIAICAGLSSLVSQLIESCIRKDKVD